MVQTRVHAGVPAQIVWLQLQMVYDWHCGEHGLRTRVIGARRGRTGAAIPLADVHMGYCLRICSAESCPWGGAVGHSAMVDMC